VNKHMGVEKFFAPSANGPRGNEIQFLKVSWSGTRRAYVKEKKQSKKRGKGNMPITHRGQPTYPFCLGRCPDFQYRGDRKKNLGTTKENKGEGHVKGGVRQPDAQSKEFEKAVNGPLPGSSVAEGLGLRARDHVLLPTAIGPEGGTSCQERRTSQDLSWES